MLFAVASDATIPAGNSSNGSRLTLTDIIRTKQRSLIPASLTCCKTPQLFQATQYYMQIYFQISICFAFQLCAKVISGTLEIPTPDVTS